MLPNERARPPWRTLFLLLLGSAHLISISATQSLLAGLVIYVVYRIYRQDYHLNVFPYVITFAIIFLLASLSAPLGVNPEKSLKKIFGWWIYLFFPTMFLMVYYEENILPRLACFITLGANVAATVGAYQFFIGGMDRATGFFAHALTYANTLSIVLCLVIAMLLSHDYTRRWEFWYYALSLPLILLGLGISISRGPMLSALITLLLILVIRLRRRGVLICGLILVFSGLLIVSTPDLKNRYVELVDKSWADPHTSVGVRIPLWKVAVKIIADHPIFGIGERNFRQVALAHLETPLHTMAHAHNAYLQFALTHGIPAFCVLAYLLARIFLVATRKALSAAPFGLASLAVLCVFLLEGLTENVLGDSEVAMLFFSLMGAFTGLFQRDRLPLRAADPSS
ncbi:MAG: O-antigen ligase family protein [Desulfosarcinaceae bacterium]|nr:O-antigen ligase family protein [Desulfosarcinaceae bacterium]